MEIEEILKLNDEGINKKFDALLRDREWDDLQDFGKKLLSINENSFIGAFSFVIGSLQTDFVHPQESYFKMHFDEMEYDFKTRLYFLARKKYKFANTKTKDILHDLYPDSLDEDGKKEKSPSSFDQKYNFYCKQYQTIIMLKEKYLPILQKNAVGIRQTRFLQHYLDWCDEVIFGKTELERYRNEVDACLLIDYKKTPDAGNGTKFFVNLFLFLISLAVTFFCGGTFISQYYKIVPIEKLNVSIVTLSYITSVVIMLYAFSICYLAKVGRKHPFKAVVVILIAALIASYGLAITLSNPTAKGTILWYLLVGAVLSLLIVLFSGFLLFRYFPRHTNIHKTRIGDTERLLNDASRVEFQFHWRDNPKTIENLFKKEKND